MNQSQIAALSQIQAQAIVHARKSQGTPQQIQTQIQLQAQALVHAHTQAQIAAGIYKGDESPAAPPAASAAAAAAASVKGAPAPVAPSPSAATVAPSPVGPTAAPLEPASTGVPNPVMVSTSAPLLGAADPANLSGPMETSSAGLPSEAAGGVMVSGDGIIHQAPAPSSSSPQFLAQLNGSLDKFWKDQLQSVQELKEQTEQDFKTHNDLPLARIKRIMKSDEDVRMISAEAPVLFAKACELFILDLSIRSWNYSQLHKRRTLQKEDIREAIQKTDIFDFLVDVI
jgi:nuclear transcription factor Y gamma